jgi:hypothetical protein
LSLIVWELILKIQNVLWLLILLVKVMNLSGKKHLMKIKN